jgi:hypothetical protein
MHPLQISTTPGTHSSGSSPALVQRNLVRRALYLDEVERFALQLDNVAQDGAGFGQFILVAGDEVESRWSRDRHRATGV